MTCRRMIALLFIFTLAGCAANRTPEGPGITAGAIALKPDDASETGVGRLRFLGGLHLESADGRFGGHSGLRWRDGRLFTVMDDGRWSSFEPVEKDGRLTGVRGVATGDLRGIRGEALSGKTAGDAESLALDEDGNWLVGFERDHRIWRYTSLTAPAQITGIDLNRIFGALAPNNGVEAIAAATGGLVVCAERAARAQPNCALLKDETATEFAVSPPPPVDRLGGVPTDADMAADGVTYFLFRSFSPADGPGAAIAARAPDGTVEPIAVLRPPLSVDNMEGLALREDGGRRFFYLISDDNFSPSQRTLLMKFELIAASGEK